MRTADAAGFGRSVVVALTELVSRLAAVGDVHRTSV